MRLLIICLSAILSSCGMVLNCNKDTRVYIPPIVYIKSELAGSVLGSGTGAIVSEDTILTAFHVCTMLFKHDFLFKKAYTVDGKSGNVSFLAGDAEHDICLLKSDKSFGPNFFRLSKTPPKRNVNYYTYSSPKGILLPMRYDGYFAGSSPTGKFDMYTIPATKGSSGAPVLNQNGEIIGMTAMVFTDIPHASFGPSYSKIKELMQR